GDHAVGGVPELRHPHDLGVSLGVLGGVEHEVEDLLRLDTLDDRLSLTADHASSPPTSCGGPPLRSRKTSYRSPAGPTQRGSGSTRWLVRAQRAASAVDDSIPAATRARNAAPRAPPSGTATTSTGSAVQSARAWIQARSRVPPPVATILRTGTPPRSMWWRTTKPAASSAARRMAAASWVRSSSCSPARRSGS